MCGWTYYLPYAPLAEITLLLPNRPRVNVPPRCASKGLQLVPLWSANNRPKASSHPLPRSSLSTHLNQSCRLSILVLFFKNIEVSVGAIFSLNFDCLSILIRLSFFIIIIFSKDLFSNDVSVLLIGTISFSLTDRRFWFQFRKSVFLFYIDLILVFVRFVYLDVSLGATISLIFYCFSILIWVSKIRFSFLFFLSWSWGS